MRRRRRRRSGSGCRARCRRRCGRRDSRLPSSRSWWSRTRRRTESEKPPSSSISFAPHSAWRLTTSYSSLSSGPGFFRIESGTESLPMSWTSAADRERSQPARREAELLADLDGAQRDAARVLLGVLVLLGEPERDRADVRAEEDLFGGDEIGRMEVAGERARRRPCARGRVRPGCRRSGSRRARTCGRATSRGPSSRASATRRARCRARRGRP